MAAQVVAGAEAAKSVEEAITGAFTCAKDCMVDVLEMKHMAEAEAHNDAEKFTARESAVKACIDKIFSLAGDKFNIIVVRDYGRDKKHFEEARSHMPNFRVEYAKGQFETFRIYLFTEGTYDRPMGPSWEGDGIQWYPEFEGEKPPGCMYLEKFPKKPGMSEAERRAAGDSQLEKDDEQKNHDLDTQAELAARDKEAAEERARWSAPNGGEETVGSAVDGDGDPPPAYEEGETASKSAVTQPDQVEGDGEVQDPADQNGDPKNPYNPLEEPAPDAGEDGLPENLQSQETKPDEGAPEQADAEEAPVDSTQTEEPAPEASASAEQEPEEPASEEPAPEEPAPEEPTTEEPTSEEPPTEDAPTEEPAPVEPAPEEGPAEEAPTEEAPNEED